MFSEPAIGEQFFGRDDVLELLNKRVLALRDGYRQNIALTGQSLSGKSSIILHFLHLIREEGFLPIYVEVVKEPFDRFARKFIATMAFNALRMRGVDAGLDFDKLLSKTREIFPRTASAIKQVLTAVENNSLDDAYAQLLGLTSVLKGEAGISCIVILDEFDNLECLGIRNPYLSFGKVIMVQKDTMYIVTSSRNHAIKKILSEKLSLLFGNFEIVKVANFDLATAAAFIDRKTAGFDIEPSLKAFLISLTDGNPFYLDTIMAHARDAALADMTSFIGAEALSRAIVKSVYKANGLIHQYLLNYLFNLLDTRSKDQAIAVMIAIATAHNTQPEIARATRMKQADVSKHLTPLIEAGLITKNGVFYSFDDTMLAFWLAHVYRARKEMLVDGAIDKNTLYAADIAGHIADFAKESSRDVTERVAELFNQFSNDLVQIDSKSLRLPHFTRVDRRATDSGRQFIVASFSRNFWTAQVCDAAVTENDIVEYIRLTKALGQKIACKIIVPLAGMDENAKLLAKELKIAIWERDTINALLGFYGKKRIVLL